ncbi:MAG: lipopolysaccharide heptosyltransferase II [Deltaproteobacteria bacterium]
MRNIDKILFITLSNIGDVILTLPVLDVLKENFPGAKITVFTGLRPKQIFDDNDAIDKVVIYNKQAPFKEKIALFFALRKEKFDMVVDLRTSLLGAFIPARYKTGLLSVIPKNIVHMKDRHLYKIKYLMHKVRKQVNWDAPKQALRISAQDEEYAEDLLRRNQITAQDDNIIVVSPGARSYAKRWPSDRFLTFSLLLREEFGAKVILVGDNEDASLTRQMSVKSGRVLADLGGQTNLPQLACVLKKARLVVTNDSGVLHMASYLNVPVLAIFGISSERKYGPWSDSSAVVKKDIYCRPCEEAQCSRGTLECIRSIRISDVLTAARGILLKISGTPEVRQKYDFHKILVVRTDKIGDVLLSTPVIKALRDNYPDAHIAMMVSPYTKDLVEGNPYLNEIIVYDKDLRHKSWLESMKFAGMLRGKKFDLALVLHPTNRVHLLAFFAGIPMRVGYDRKMGFLLTDRLSHTKQLGEKHESEYSLDLVRYLGIEPQDKSLFMPVDPHSERWADKFLAAKGVDAEDKLLAIHPGASCPSRIWPSERFAEVADRLIEKYGFKVILVSDRRGVQLTQKIAESMHHPVIDLTGRTSIGELASILRRCRLFISNDSGPVHIGCAVGVAVITIFGRKQPGLSPKRWGALSDKSRILHGDAGCIECRAHNCVKEFACLKTITVDDVVNAANSILA